MDLLQVLILAVVQGAAELLPVSSSAHVIMAEKLMGLDPTDPQMTLLLVMLHTGTMFAVILYFWSDWQRHYFASKKTFLSNLRHVVLATGMTGVVGLTLQAIIKHLVAGKDGQFEIEQLFGNATLIGCSLFAAGLLILLSSRLPNNQTQDVNTRSALGIGFVQGLCLPFRGFSRSGATISTGMVMGVNRHRAEAFSFALAVVLTPVVILKEGVRLAKSDLLMNHPGFSGFMHLLAPSLVGMVLSFIAGLVALRWLSSWLEQGRWHFFGLYCFAAGIAMFVIG